MLLIQSQTDIVAIIKSKRIGCTEHVLCAEGNMINIIISWIPIKEEEKRFGTNKITKAWPCIQDLQMIEI